MVRAAAAASLILAVFAAGCAAVPVPPTLPSQVPELWAGAGYLIGYLPRKALPDSLALLPLPPADGSAAAAADLDAYRSARALKGSPRWAAAADDSVLTFPQAAGAFACALDLAVSQEATPHLNMLLRRSLADAALATDAAKVAYKRTRPFARFGEGSCTPGDEAMLAKDGSYPSGHAALGWAWALVLSEISPERANDLLARGQVFAQSRVVCGVHWQSDVDAGKVIGAATVARLHADPVFTAQIEAAKREVLDARARGATASGDCAAQARVLGVGR